MKIKKTFTLFVLVTLVSFSMQSCGIFGGGDDCDCPKFGQVYQTNSAIQLLAIEVISAAQNY